MVENRCPSADHAAHECWFPAPLFRYPAGRRRGASRTAHAWRGRVGASRGRPDADRARGDSDLSRSGGVPGSSHLFWFAVACAALVALDLFAAANLYRPRVLGSVRAQVIGVAAAWSAV